MSRVYWLVILLSSCALANGCGNNGDATEIKVTEDEIAEWERLNTAGAEEEISAE